MGPSRRPAGPTAKHLGHHTRPAAWMPVIAPTLGLLLILGGCGSSEPPAAEPPSTDQVPATRESGPQGIGVTTPADTPAAPARGFLLGTLPVPADGQTFEEAYRQASRYAGFAPVWGRPTPPFELADDLGGDWGEVVEEYIRGNGMIPLVQMSFIGAGLSLAAPPGMAGATLSDPDWRRGLQVGRTRRGESLQAPLHLDRQRGQSLVREVRQR